MCDLVEEASLLVRSHLHAWMRIPHLKPLARAVRRDEELLIASVARILGAEGKSPRDRADEARSHIVQYALEHIGIAVGAAHFTLFKEAETVQVILEDAFGVEIRNDRDVVTPPFQEEVARMIVRCLFRQRRRPIRAEEIVSFLRTFSNGGSGEGADHDRIMRYKSMVWFAYLLIDLIRVDEEAVRQGGPGYLKTKFKDLLDKVLEGKIIDERFASPRYNYEGGRWDRTLFGWLQGEDRKPFVEKLVKQFNLDNRVEHGSRLLLASHRECMYRQVVGLFCRAGSRE